jgi:hypothetical protein
MSNKVLRPPEIHPVEDDIIFLAGPIQGAHDWQSEAIEIFSDLATDLTIACPRKDYAEGEFIYEKQVDWETRHLRLAATRGVILFWLAAQTIETPGRSYAQTTRFELAESKMKHQYESVKMVIGIEEGFGNARYIRRRFSQDCPKVPILSSLASTCEVALELLDD